MSVYQLKNLLEGSLKRAGIYQKVTATQLIEEFKNIVQRKWGRQALSRILPKYVKKGTITIQIKDAVYLAELKLNEEKIIEEINRKHKGTAVKRLRLLIN